MTEWVAQFNGGNVDEYIHDGIGDGGVDGLGAIRRRGVKQRDEFFDSGVLVSLSSIVAGGVTGNGVWAIQERGAVDDLGLDDRVDVDRFAGDGVQQAADALDRARELGEV